MLPIHRSVPGTASSLLGRVVEVPKDLEAVQTPKDLETHVIIEQHLQLTVNEWSRRVLSGDPPPTINSQFCMVCPKLPFTDELLAISTMGVQSQSQLTVMLQASPEYFLLTLVFFSRPMTPWDLYKTDKQSKGNILKNKC